jgi:hypothetical protein
MTLGPSTRRAYSDRPPRLPRPCAPRSSRRRPRVLRARRNGKRGQLARPSTTRFAHCTARRATGSRCVTSPGRTEYRAIAAATGVDPKTVRNDLATGELPLGNSPVETQSSGQQRSGIGLDGRERVYPTRPAPSRNAPPSPESWYGQHDEVDTPQPVRPAPVMLNLLDHTGRTWPYPKPQSQSTFNETTGDGISWAAWSWNPVTGCLHGCGALRISSPQPLPGRSHGPSRSISLRASAPSAAVPSQAVLTGSTATTPAGRPRTGHATGRSTRQAPDVTPQRVTLRAVMQQQVPNLPG